MAKAESCLWLHTALDYQLSMIEMEGPVTVIYGVK